MKKISIAALTLVAFFSGSAVSERFWTAELVNWRYMLNNGVGYVLSESFPEECSHNRAQINFSSTDEYTKKLAAYVLAASKTGEKLKVVLDHDRSSPLNSVTCVILSADAWQ